MPSLPVRASLQMHTTYRWGRPNVICIKTSAGFVGCGFFDLSVFEKLGIPAAKVTGVASIEDMLRGNVIAATPLAVHLGAKSGVSGEGAVKRLSR